MSERFPSYCQACAQSPHRSRRAEHKYRAADSHRPSLFPTSAVFPSARHRHLSIWKQNVSHSGAWPRPRQSAHQSSERIVAIGRLTQTGPHSEMPWIRETHLEQVGAASDKQSDHENSARREEMCISYLEVAVSLISNSIGPDSTEY